jgi:hypothetical protein
MSVLCASTGMLVWVAAVSAQQAPARRPAAQPGAAAQQIHGNLNQVMRGILFPNSNVVFASQSNDPAAIKPADDQSGATDPLESIYGGWAAVENSALALAESANLLTIRGRRCANGKLAPVGNADWGKFVVELRAAGLASYKAAQSKNQDQMLDAADKLSTACSNCHEKYREKPREADRCTP